MQVMLGSKRGGLELMAVTYARVLNQPLVGQPHSDYGCARVIPFKTFGKYDFTAGFRLAKLVTSDTVFLHGNRAIALAKHLHARQKIAVVHNIRTKASDLKHCTHIIGVSKEIAAAVGGMHIPNAIELLRFNPAPIHNPMTFGTLSRLHYRKGLDVLIAALPTGSRLLIAGEGEEEAKLKAQAKQKDIEFLGWQKPAEFFTKIDCLVVPSREEPFGLTLIEAMSAGVSVIATPTAGPSEIITDGVNGTLTTFENLSETLKNFSRQETLIQNARAHVEANYSLTVLETRLKGLIQGNS